MLVWVEVTQTFVPKVSYCEYKSIVLNSQHAAKKGMVYKFLYPFVGEGLISGSGSDFSWISHRKMFLTTMNQRILREHVKIFDKRCRMLTRKLENLADRRTIDIHDYVEGCTIDLASETILGCDDVNALDNPDHEFARSTAEMYEIVYTRMFRLWMHPDCVFRLTSKYERQRCIVKVIHNFTEKCIAAKREESLNNSHDVERISILEQILEANDVTHALTDDEIRDEIYTVFLAAQDTLAIVSSFASLMFAMHPEIQEKARKEIREIWSEDEPVTLEHLNRMKYLECCVKETLRLFPIAPLLIRHLKSELALGTCTLPENCQVVIAAYVTHRSEKYWRSPEEFVPERFTSKETAERHSHVFIPFSGGPMSCIGQKYALLALKAILAHVLQHYRMNTHVKMTDIQLKSDISIRSINGYKVSLEALMSERRHDRC
ncbi:cytochrome P450 4C1-like isoform X2 [Venturia canescens]|uniref:cytochrome P450 4C1-like isoform X2 n=1 Tax=Venturia canescens TaxID=32260 RepID=UPI001C9CF87A|nr:cytochrome P450 4C1-like isoform X2 [Venturia canescens]